MALIQDEVQVSNLALDMIKVAAVSSIRNPKTEAEKICSRWYDTSRRSVLRAHPWNFAKDRYQCSRNAIAPVFGYSDKYGLPNDFMRLWFIGTYNEGLIHIDFAIEGKFIVLNNGGAASLNIGYIKDETEVAKWDDLFIRYLAAQMAFNMSYAFSGKSTLRKDVKDVLADVKIEARAVNGQDNPPKRITKSKVIGARRAYASGGGYVNNDPTIIPGS